MDGETTNASATTKIPEKSFTSSVSAGITLSPTSADVNEAGSSTDTYSIALNTTPASAVTITVTVSDGETQVSNDGSTFGTSTTVALSDTSAATITVKAVDDADNEGAHTGTISHAITTGDSGDYPTSLSIADLTVNIADNDATGGWVINEILADPDASNGDANGDGSVGVADDEFVEMINNTGAAVDISGWTLSDGVGIKHTFSSGTVVADGCGVVVFGGGTPTGNFGYMTAQIASNGSLGLNNGGDTVTLNDGSSDVASETYGGEGGDNQSLTRNPDLTGSFVKHSTLSGSALFSPGTQNDGSQFSGCTISVNPQPTNHPTVFTATADSDTQITTSWTDAVAGAQAPAGYLVMCSTSNSFTDPVDGTAQTDNDCADGSGVQNSAHGSGASYAWTGLTASTQYYFKIFPYTNSGSSIDYKTDATPLTANATTHAPVVREQLAIWTFDGLSGVAHGVEIAPTAEDVLGTTVLQAFNQDIDDNGKGGVGYTDVKSVTHSADKALAWDDIKGDGSDAELLMSINTTHWSDLALRFDYETDSADSFDLEYSTNGGLSWNKPFNNESITANAGSYTSKSLDLSSETGLNNQAFVLFKFSDFDNNGNDKLKLDNLEITGVKDTAAFAATPTITAAATTTPYLQLNQTGMGFVNGAVSDPTDPAQTLGIDFTIADPDTAVTSLTITASSNYQPVVADANLVLSGTGANRHLKITPSARGYADITVTVSDGSNSGSYVIRYDASNAASEPANARFHAGAADGSAAVAIDAVYMLVADDEDQVIRVYHRSQSGLPVKVFDMNAALGLEGQQEADLEAVTRVGNTLYWIGSHSNNSSGEEKLDREILFSTSLSGTGSSTTLTYVNQYTDLENDLEAWDSSNGHGLGADALGLTASAVDGVAPEASVGFSIEGLSMKQGSSSVAYLGFRAPLMDTGSRDKALIVPVSNFNALPGASVGSATFGTPIQLDLGGRGIRSLECSSDGCLIIAGPASSSGGFALYTWSGNSADAPELRSVVLNGEGSFEGVVELPTGNFLGSNGDAKTVQLIRDNGDTDWYNTSTAAKNLVQDNWKKCQSDIVTLGAVVVPSTSCDKTNASHCIHEVQGSGASSLLNGTTVTIEGIVTGDFQASDELKGFFVQEEDADVDGSALTSEGLFVYCDACATAVAVGDKVQVTGSLVEYFDLTELTSISNVTVVSTGNPLPTAANITLPLASSTALEAVEGMLVNFPQTLIVTDNYNLGRGGYVGLSSGARLNIGTNVAAPGSAANAITAANVLNRIILDDGSMAQNPDPVRFSNHPSNPLSATHTLRGGDSVTGLKGVLSYSFSGWSGSDNAYRVHATDTVNFSASNPRPATPAAVGGSLKVAGFNVLNYFTTTGSGNNCSPSGTMGCRGASNATEFTRQRDKIIAAINTIDADIVGLMEVENTTASSGLQDLVNGLNAVAGTGTYDYVNSGTIGSDAIRVGLIYKPGTVSVVGSHAILDSSVNANFIDSKNRPSLAQTFQQTATGEKLTVVVNHFKSKGSDCNSLGDPDAGDGQGNCNLTRTKAATALKNWLATDPTSSGDTDFLLIGDFNAYAKEDPITTLEAAGYVNKASGYSYSFKGEWGSLDHALVSSSLNAQVTGATKWHINADEPKAMDYNTEFNLASFYSADAYRSSDHDPIIVGFNLTTPPVTPPPSNNSNNSRPTPPLNLQLTALSDTEMKLVWDDVSGIESGYYVYREGDLIATLDRNTELYTDSGLTCETTYAYQVFAFNSNGKSTTAANASAETLTCAGSSNPTTPGSGAALGEQIRLINNSVRCHIDSGQSLAIAGFIIRGTGEKTVLLRAMRSAITQVANYDLQLTLVRRTANQTWQPVANNDNWQTGLNAANIATLPAHLQLRDSRDAGLLTVLQPGVYTALAQLKGPAGIGVLGVDDLDDGSTTSWLSNFSGRCQAAQGQANAVLGVVLQGQGALDIVLRGMGVATLNSAAFDPQVSLYRLNAGAAQLLQENDNWDSSNVGRLNTLAKHLRPRHQLDTGMRLTLSAGTYTLNMSPTNGVAGIGVLGLDLAP